MCAGPTQRSATANQEPKLLQNDQSAQSTEIQRHGCQGGGKVVGFGVGDRIWIFGFVVVMVDDEEDDGDGCGMMMKMMRLWDNDEEEEWMENLENDEAGK
ncbi:hypothetical protein QYF36_022565 [Acer negundo]|nr:hypothetical protein QYF36_022565 [Acer negundo]